MEREYLIPQRTVVRFAVIAGGRRRVSSHGKLLTVSNFFDTHRGGVEIVAGRLARELSARGFAVTWLASNATAEPDGYAGCGLTLGSLAVWNVAERRLGVPWPVLSLAAAARLWREVRGADAVLLHDSLFMTSIVTFLAAKAAGTPLAVMEKKTIFATLDHCSGNKRRAAEVLGVSLKTLYNRLAEYAADAADLAPPTANVARIGRPA